MFLYIFTMAASAVSIATCCYVVHSVKKLIARIEQQSDVIADLARRVDNLEEYVGIKAAA